MLPTLNVVGDVVLVDCLSAKLGWIRMGDILVYKSPLSPAHVVCKRVVGLVRTEATRWSTRSGFEVLTVPLFLSSLPLVHSASLETKYALIHC